MQNMCHLVLFSAEFPDECFALNLFPEQMGTCLKKFQGYNPLSVGCSPLFSLIARELQVLSCLSTAISCDPPVKGRGGCTVVALAEKGDKCSKASFQRGAVLINRSSSEVAVLLEGT